MVADEAGTKVLRFIYFVGAGVICTKGINMWREYERKNAIKAAEAAHTPAEIVAGASTVAAASVPDS